jgi:hypothetical protein
VSDPKTQIAQELDKSRRAREAAERNAAIASLQRRPAAP